MVVMLLQLFDFFFDPKFLFFMKSITTITPRDHNFFLSLLLSFKDDNM